MGWPCCIECDKIGEHKQSSYGKSTDKIPIYCADHAKSMNKVEEKNKSGIYYVDIIHKKCIECIRLKVKRPKIGNFNKEGETIGLYCSHHANDDMINVVDETCENIINGKRCENIPSFNYRTEKRPIYCKKCVKLKNLLMVDRKNKMCEGDGDTCLIRANFAPEGQIKPILCGKHAKLETKKTGIEYFDIKSKKCEGIDGKKCKCGASFNVPTTKVRRFCKTCMEIYCERNKVYMVNVAHKNCETCIENKEPDPRRAKYNYFDMQPAYCGIDRELNMITKPTKKCEHCHKFPAIYGKGKERFRCVNCKLPEDVLLIKEKCNNCDAKNIIDENGICEKCDVITKKQKTWELMMKNNLDKKINIKYDACNSRIKVNGIMIELQCRPDFMYTRKNKYIFVEVDEHQHNDERYRGSDMIRMKKIQNILDKKVVFIRFNPNNFRVNDVLQDLPISKRFDIFNEQLIKRLNSEPKYELEIDYMFYNNCPPSYTITKALLTKNKH